jgi:hypothetical protein
MPSQILQRWLQADTNFLSALLITHLCNFYSVKGVPSKNWQNMEEINKQYDKNSKLINIYLIGIILALFVVGLDSGTLIRHIIQIIPIVITLILVARRIWWTTFASLAIFIFWFIVMCIIWMHLLNIAHIVHGQFTLTQIIMTIVMAVCGVLGAVSSIRNTVRRNRLILSLMLILFLSIQFFAIWLSMRPSIAYT